MARHFAAHSRCSIPVLVSTCNWALQGACSGCGLVIQALAAAVAVGELALCSPPPAFKPAPLAVNAASGGGAAAEPGSPAAGDAAAAAAAAAGTKEAAAAAAAAAPGGVSDLPKSAILLRLMACSLSVGAHGQRMTDEMVEAHAAEIAEIQADDLAAAHHNKSATTSSRQRRLRKGLEAEVRAGQAASCRLLATAVAGLAGLTSAAAAAAQRPTDATGQQHDAGLAAQRVLESAADRETLKNLLRKSSQLAMAALDTAKHLPDLAPDLIEV